MKIMKTGKFYLRFFVAFFALWLSVLSFTTALAISVRQPSVLFAFTQKKELADPDWIKNFENQISKADTLNLSFSDNGYVQALYDGQKNASLLKKSVANASGFTAGAQEKIVLPVKIEIPRLKKSLKVDNPNTTKISELNKGLKKAVLRYPGTGRLDENSRDMLIFGHSSHLPTDMVFNQMYRAFNGIEKLSAGDIIYVYGDDGSTHVYKVSKVEKVKASSDVIFVATPNKKLTLITCDNFGAKEDRWVVEADFAYKK